MEKVLSTFIRKRNNNFCVYVEYINNEGKKKQKSQGSYKTKKEADERLIELKNSINKGRYAVPSDVTFVDRCYKYYDDKVNELSANTVYNQKNTIRRYIEPYWGDTKLCNITVSSYQNFVNYTFSRDLSTNTKKNIIRTSSAVLRECYRCQEIQTKITDFIRIPKTTKTKEVEIYSVDDIKYLLECAKKRPSAFEITLNLFAYGGLRRGEALGLTWDCVDFDNETITIEKNLQYVKNKFVMKSTKTDSSIRTIALPDHVMDILRKEKIRQNKMQLKGLMLTKEYDTVCINRKGNYYNPLGFNRDYQNFIESIGLHYIKPHALRHAHVSMLIASGMDIKTISARVGHSNTDMTLKVYAHMFRENDKKAAEKIDDILCK